MTNTALSFGVDEPIALGPDGTAPTELRLFRRGENRTAKGVFVFDDAAAAAVMSTYAEMGRKWVMVDYDHGSLQKAPVDPSRSSRAAGTARLELRGGDLWATNIRWTPDAKKAIEAGEWPSISPAFSHDDKGRPSWLINFGLTGNPATFAPAELIAANAITERLDALEAALSKDAGDRSHHEQQRAERAPEETLAMNFAEMMKKKKKVVMEALGMDESAFDKMMGDYEEEMACKKKLSASEALPTDVMALSVGLASTASQADVTGRIGALAATEKELLSVTGEKGPSAALGVVEAWKKDAGRAKTLGETLAKIEDEKRKTTVETALNTALSEKRITKPEVEGKDGKGGLREKGLQDPEWLVAHLSTREPIAALAINHEQPKTTPKGGSAEPNKIDLGDRKFEQLSGMEQARLYRDAPEQYASLKADWEDRGKPAFASLTAAA